MGRSGVKGVRGTGKRLGDEGKGARPGTISVEELKQVKGKAAYESQGGRLKTGSSQTGHGRSKAHCSH